MKKKVIKTKRLTHLYEGLYFDSEGYNRANGETEKLGKLEDIEEELGCDLYLYLKMTTGTTLYSNKHNHPEIEQNWNKYIYYNNIFDNRPCFCLYIGNKLTPMYYVEDYGKTWALTKEELENEK